MTTVESATVGPSLIEMAAAKLGSMARGRRERKAGAGPLSALGEVLGTIAALVCFTVAAFAVGFAVGMAVAGVALLLLDFKVTVVRRRRAAMRGRR